MAYGILACVTVAAAIGELTVANLAAHGSVITVVPAAAGVIVARQRNLAQRLAAANEQLRHEQELRLATVAARERNRVARELHDVVAHGVSVMVVQAGAARITLRDEPVMARAALRALAGERTHMVRELDSSVAERVSGMIVLAEATDAMASADPEAAISSIAGSRRPDVRPWGRCARYWASCALSTTPPSCGPCWESSTSTTSSGDPAPPAGWST